MAPGVFSEWPLHQGAELFHDVVLVGEATRLFLRVDKLFIRNHVEDPASTLDQLRLDPQVLPQCGRQTGSPRKVVSTDAVCNRDRHVMGSFEAWFQFTTTVERSAIVTIPCH
jgi:hypothetical protein